MTTHLDEYLSLVLPWDGDDAATYKVVMTSFVKDGKKLFTHAAASSYADFVRLVRSRIGFSTDVWVALGAYRDAKQEFTRDGFAKIQRVQRNVASMRSIYLDIDVGPDDPDKKYGSSIDAFNDLQRFIGATSMPAPTLMVNSGSGGLHVYWTLDEALSPDQWSPLAHALANAARHARLKFDSQCTVDCARVLRPPESYNYKAIPPNPVQMHQPTRAYTFDELRAPLTPFFGPRVVASNPAIPPRPTTQPLGGLAGNFTSGVATGAPPADLYAIADAGCGVIGDALDTGGEKHAQPLWNMLALAATFDVDPVATFHAMSDKHPSYVAADTDAMIQRKLGERASNPQLGWPTCRSFSLLHPACQTCAFFANGKTPFHLPRAPQATPNFTQAQPVNDLPLGFWRPAGMDVVMGDVKDLKTGAIQRIKVLEYPLHEGVLRGDTGALVFKTDIGGRARYIEVPTMSGASRADMLRSLFAQQIMVEPHQEPHVRTFMTAWLKRLQDIKKPTILPAQYGWSDDLRFVYGDKSHGPTSSDDVFMPDMSTTRMYVPKGDAQPWIDATNLITSQNNPALECIIAAGFAGPLVKFTGQSGLLFSAYSVGSGHGKTTALRISQAIFGDPVRGLNALSDTENSVMKKLSDLRHITLNWDELKTHGEIEKFVSVAFRLGQGKDKSRLHKDSTAHDVGSFATMLVACSNDSLFGALTRATKTTAAGAYRCFEIEVPKSTSFNSTAQVSAMIAKLETNYGVVGERYAEYLGRNGKAVEAMTQKMLQAVEHAVSQGQQERFWIATIATILTGAGIANAIGLAKFNIQSMQDFLFETLAELRSQRQSNVFEVGGANYTAEDILQDLLQATNNRNLLVTNRVHGLNPGQTRPNKIEVRCDVGRLQHVWAQIGVDDAKLLLASGPFNDWLAERRLPVGLVMRELQTRCGLRRGRGSIGAGVSAMSGLSVLRTSIIELDLTGLNNRAPAPSPGSS